MQNRTYKIKFENHINFTDKLVIKHPHSLDLFNSKFLIEKMASNNRMDDKKIIDNIAKNK